MKKKLLFLGLLVSSVSFTHAQWIINTIAGNGVASYSGDGGQATVAELYYPEGIAEDPAGNLIIGDWNNHRVRKVTPAGIITTIAGNGVSGFSGDGGQATAAEITLPMGVAADNLGNVYIADESNARIRKVNAAGVMSTVAGTGISGYTGDGGPAVTAEIEDCLDVVVDGAGNFYLSDFSSTIRKVTVASGIITRYAGSGSWGFSGDGGQATAATIAQPWGMWVDPSGTIMLIADTYNQRLRRVAPSGIITTIAGNGVVGGSGDGGPATAAELNYLTGVTVDAVGNAYIADIYNEKDRMVTPGGIISAVAGTGVLGFSGDGGPATAAELYYPRQIVMDPAGNIVFGDLFNQRVRRLTPAALPITLLSFDAVYQADNTVLTTWVTATEKNNKIFTIEKSGDGEYWQTVTTIPGAGNSSKNLYYHAVDENPWAGASYYRLMQTDYDGNYTYSDIVMVNAPETQSLEIYPNPVIDKLTMHYNSLTTSAINVRIISLSGAEVVPSYTISNVNAGMNEFNINTTALSKGMYIMVIGNGENTYYKKFIKQ